MSKPINPMFLLPYLTSLESLVKQDYAFDQSFEVLPFIGTLQDITIPLQLRRSFSFENITLDEHVQALQLSFKTYYEHCQRKMNYWRMGSKIFDLKSENRQSPEQFAARKQGATKKQSLQSFLKEAKTQPLLWKFVEHITAEFPINIAEELLILTSRIFFNFIGKKGSIFKIEDIIFFARAAGERLAGSLFTAGALPILSLKKEEMIVSEMESSEETTVTEIGNESRKGQHFLGIYEGFKRFTQQFYCTVALIMEEIYINPLVHAEEAEQWASCTSLGFEKQCQSMCQVDLKKSF